MLRVETVVLLHIFVETGMHLKVWGKYELKKKTFMH